MGFTKRYYSPREAAEVLGIPVHQIRRWVKQFLPGSRQGRIRLSQKDMERLRLVYQGFYAYRLRGKALKAFLDGTVAKNCPPEPYAVIREINNRLKALEARLDSFRADWGGESPSKETVGALPSRASENAHEHGKGTE